MNGPRRRRVQGLDVAVCQRDCHQVRPGPRTQLRHAVPDVGARGLRRDVQLLGDLRAGQPKRDQGDDFALAAGQLAGLTNRFEPMCSLLPDDHDDGDSSPVHDCGSGGVLSRTCEPSARVKTRTPDRSRVTHSWRHSSSSVKRSAGVSRSPSRDWSNSSRDTPRTRTPPHSRRSGSRDCRTPRSGSSSAPRHPRRAAPSRPALHTLPTPGRASHSSGPCAAARRSRNKETSGAITQSG